MNWSPIVDYIAKIASSIKKKNVLDVSRIIKPHGVKFVLVALVKVFRPVYYVMNFLTLPYVTNTIIFFQKQSIFFSGQVVQKVLILLKRKV